MSFHKTKVINTDSACVHQVGFVPQSHDIISVESDPSSINSWDLHSLTKKDVALQPDDIPFTFAMGSKTGELVWAGLKGLINLWDMETKKIIRYIGDHNSSIYRVSIDSNGKYVISWGIDTNIKWSAKFWDLQAGKLIRDWGQNSYACFSPDSRYIGIRRYDVIELEEVSSGRVIHTYDETPATPIVFSPDSTHIAFSTTHRDINLLNISSGYRATIADDNVTDVDEIFFIPGHRLGTISLADSSICIWDIQSKEKTEEILLGIGKLKSIAFKQDATAFACCGHQHFRGGIIEMWQEYP